MTSGRIAALPTGVRLTRADAIRTTEDEPWRDHVRAGTRQVFRTDALAIGRPDGRPGNQRIARGLTPQDAPRSASPAEDPAEPRGIAAATGLRCRPGRERQVTRRAAPSGQEHRRLARV